MHFHSSPNDPSQTEDQRAQEAAEELQRQNLIKKQKQAEARAQAEAAVEIAKATNNEDSDVGY